MKTKLNPKALKALLHTKNLILFLKTANLHFEIDFSLKILPNRNDHLYAILFRDSEGSIELDPRDIQAFLSQFHNKIDAPISLNYAKVKYDGLIYQCIYLDILDEYEYVLDAEEEPE